MRAHNINITSKIYKLTRSSNVASPTDWSFISQISYHDSSPCLQYRYPSTFHLKKYCRWRIWTLKTSVFIKYNFFIWALAFVLIDLMTLKRLQKQTFKMFRWELYDNIQLLHWVSMSPKVRALSQGKVVPH